ncbi:hypothetical protein M3J09_009933 [Ascochyta lentis]
MTRCALLSLLIGMEHAFASRSLATRNLEYTSPLVTRAPSGQYSDPHQQKRRPT